MHRLLRNTSNNSIIEWDPTRDNNPKYVELTEDEVQGYFGYSAVKAGKTVPLDPDRDGIILYTTSMGIGDAITVLYAACGLANAGYKVIYNARHYKWLQWVSHPNLTLRPLTANEQFGGVDVNQEYMDQLWEGFIGRLDSRPHWALRAIRKTYTGVSDLVEPARPEHVIRPDPVVDGDYVALSPYSSCVGPARDWPAANYAMLVSKLVKEGYRCFVAITSEHKDDEWMFITSGAKVWIDRSPEDVTSLIANAKVLVGNDSGMSHLGGLFSVPTFAIMAHIHPSTTFRCADTVQGIVPNPRVPCRFCGWQKEGGHLKSCQAFCGALASIIPDDVLTDVLFQLRNQGSIRGVQKERE